MSNFCRFVLIGDKYVCKLCGQSVRAAGVLLPLRALCGASSCKPGTQLKAILKDWLGIESSPTCSCNRMAETMDLHGPEWCESKDGMAEILQVMRTEHAKRLADGRTILPWTDTAARHLVLLACRRARANGIG